MIILNALFRTVMFLVIATIIVLLVNYVSNKDFRNNLVDKIKRVISSTEKAKITQIKNIILDYFFIEE